MGRVILSYGMGVDSTAILLHWLGEPKTRGFDLSDLIVITAMVGDEFDSTGELVREHIVPRLRAHGVRFVQVARAGLLESFGIKVLSDTTAPTELYFDGVYKLSDEMKTAGTIPTSGGTRKCSLKYKGYVIDHWLKKELKGEPFVHVIGFESEEGNRIKRDQVYGKASGRMPSYPLFTWGWNRQACFDYIEKVTGANWLKSACTFCPFSRGCSEVMARFDIEPEGAALAVELEDIALGFNPRMKLYKTKGIRESLSVDHAALKIIENKPELNDWAIYRLTRGMKAKDERTTSQRKKKSPEFRAEPIWNFKKRGATQRSVEKRLWGYTPTSALAQIARMAKDCGYEISADGRRATIRDTGEGYPRIEEYLVAAPAVVATKHGRWGRETFDRFLGGVETLLAT